jgi:hypothetical protein
VAPKKLPAESYPLYWPEGWPRTKFRDHSKFQVTLGAAVQALAGQVRLIARGSPSVISSNIPSRADGLPYANASEPDDPGVAVYWFDARANETRVIACDRWRRVRDNLHALDLSIGALRGLSRWGASEIVTRAFGGFKALPAGTPDMSVVKRPWREVLQMPATKGLAWPVVIDIARGQHRRLAVLAHPDSGGSHEAMVALNEALVDADAEREKDGTPDGCWSQS